MPTQAQTRLIASTRDELLDACMDKAGYPAWTPPPDLPTVGGKTLTDWRYGTHDAALAAKNGYHPDPAAQAAYDEAAGVGAVDKSGADDGAVRGCVSQVDGVASTSPLADLVQQINGDTFRQAAKSQIDSGILSDDTTLVALTIGGNDAGFPVVMQLCATTGCPAEADVKRDIDNTIPQIENVLRQINTAASHAKIVLMGYPRLFNASVTTCVSGVGGAGMNRLNYMGDYMSAQQK